MCKVLRRILFMLLIPIHVFNVIFGGVVLLPYWVVTGDIYYDIKYIQEFNRRWFKLIE